MNATLQFHSEHHHAEDTEASMRIAFNRDGRCPKHPDVLLRQRYMFCFWRILQSECQRCAVEWKETREARVNPNDADPGMIRGEEAQQSTTDEQEITNAIGDNDTKIAALRGRIDELQRENDALLGEVERLRHNIDLVATSHAKEVRELKTAKEQLLKESEAVVDDRFSSLQSSLQSSSAEMISFMQKMTREVELMRTQNHQSPLPPPVATVPVGMLVAAASDEAPPADIQLPVDIQQCHTALSEARTLLLRGAGELREAESRAQKEEATLRSSLSSVLQASDVDEKLRLIRSEIETNGTVSKDAWAPWRESLLHVKAMTVAQTEHKHRIKDLQKQLLSLHLSHDFVFATADDTFSRQMGHLRLLGLTAIDLRDCRLSATHVRNAGYTARDAKDAGYPANELRIAGYSLMEIRDAGYPMREAKDAGFTLAEMRKAGYTARDANDIGVSIMEMRTAGYSVFSDEMLGAAVSLWCNNPKAALGILGHISLWDVSFVTSMKELFKDQKSFNDDISQWNVSRVTDMNNMFHGASSFNQPLSSWDVSGVTNMNKMFREASLFNQPLSSWNVSRVTDMSYMFSKASSFNQPLSSWNVSQVNNMSNMFSKASSFNQPLSDWSLNQSAVARDMFEDAPYNASRPTRR